MVMNREQLQLGNLIGHRARFEVPKYQRSYAWQEPELVDSVSDLSKIDAVRRSTEGAFRPHVLREELLTALIPQLMHEAAASRTA